MLTNIDWLAPGKSFPPAQEKSRIDLYKRNEAFFLTEHAQQLAIVFEQLRRQSKLKRYDISTILNYQQLLSKKIADFVCGEMPDIEYADEEGGSIGDLVAAVLEKERFRAKLYEAIIDVSRFGNGVAKIVDDRLTIVNAMYWFPIVSSSDLKHIIGHVIAYPTDPNEKNECTKLYAEIHTDAGIELRLYQYSKGKIGSAIMEDDSVAIGLQPNPLGIMSVFPLTNVTHSGSIYGLDDYTIINSIVQALIWRLSCADRILDKHSEPSLSGPRNALSYDQRTKSWYLDLGGYFSRDRAEDPDVKYLTWDGNLDANFKEIELLLSQLYTLSEMGTAFMEGGDAGATSSGTALRLRLVSPRIKAQRIAEINTDTVKSIIVTLCAANGLVIDPDRLSVRWNDGLPDDPIEDAQRLQVETAGKQFKSVLSAIKERGMNDEQAEEEYERIREEQNSTVPAVITRDPTVDEDASQGDGEGEGDAAGGAEGDPDGDGGDGGTIE